VWEAYWYTTDLEACLYIGKASSKERAMEMVKEEHRRATWPKKLWRVKLGDGQAVALVQDHSSRVRWMTDALACLPDVRSLVIDGELVACDDTGLPDFYALHFHSRDHGLCVWAFDLLHHNGRDLRELPLSERKARLERLILAANANWLRYSESFDDGLALLKAADRMRLEGIVSKRRDAPYRSGKQCDWIKVKCETWREANKERWRLFERRS
jgi:ATP dependent DNA ligase domain